MRAGMGTDPIAIEAFQRKGYGRRERAIRHETPKMSAAQYDDIRHADGAGDMCAGGFCADIKTATPEEGGGFAQVRPSAKGYRATGEVSLQGRGERFLRGVSKN